MLITILTHMGQAYQAVRVVQDSGLWTIEPEHLRQYLEAWTEDRKARKGR